jgi:3-oxoacyl-(acyl-carrier-protein) synthase
LNRICVTGLGVISSIGHDTGENRESLRNGVSGLSKDTSTIVSRYVGRLPFGEITLSTETLKQQAGASEAGVTRTELIALKAFEEAVAGAGLSPEEVRSPDTALIGASTVGGMCLTNELYQDANKKEGGSEYLFSYDCASINIYIARKHGITGINNTINTACSSSANAIMFGARLIKHGLARRAVVGGVDSLAKFTINGFNSLFILSSEKCRPFDAGRNGLNLGEAGAFIVLEKEEDCQHKKIHAVLSGYGNANDAFHPSSLSEEGDGPYLSMKLALDEAGLEAGQIDYINAHGTGTENNDEAESKAIIKLFHKPPPFTSTKSNTGHTLGAAGCIEAIYSILSIDGQEIFPELNFDEPIASTGLIPETSLRAEKLNHVMSNSFGFGGNCTSLIFSKA